MRWWRKGRDALDLNARGCGPAPSRRVGGALGCMASGPRGVRDGKGASRVRLSGRGGEGASSPCSPAFVGSGWPEGAFGSSMPRPSPRPRRGFRLLGREAAPGKPAVASGRDLGLRVCPALRPCGWEGLSPTGSGGGVRILCCDSLVYSAVGIGTLTCSLLYFAPNIVVGAVTAKRVEACSAAPLSCNYWEEILNVLSVPAVGCVWCCAHASAAVTGGGGSEPSGAGNVEGANLSWSSLDVQRLCVALWAELRIRGVGR